MTKQDYINLLQNNILLVTFTKKDGSIRELTCSLKKEAIDKHYEIHSKPTNTRRTADNQVSCIDLEINEFRSFLVESVIEYKVL